MKTVEIPVDNNAYVKAFIVSDEGDIGILYKGASFQITLKTRGEEINEEPITIGPSLQVRIVKV